MAGRAGGVLPSGLAELERLQESSRGLASLKQELSDLSRGLDADRTDLDHALRAARKAEDDFLENAAALDGFFGKTSPWRAGWEADPKDFVERLERQVPEYLSKLEAKTALETELGNSRLRREGVAPLLESARREAQESRRLLQEERDALLGLRRERSGLLDGRPVPLVREEIASRQDALARELDQRQAELDRRSQELERHLTLRQTRSEEAATLESRILREGPERIEDWSSCLREGRPDPTTLGTALREALRGAEQDLSQAREEKARLEAELDLDGKAAEEAALLRSRIVERSAVVERWAALWAAVGSSDGKKFKVVAQRFTLEALLEEANEELSRITPRYRLRLLDESMHFGVVDADSFGEMRPVHTLSGGESFIVSLALALGLSRLAGGALRVESLFIDEGFGTLDSSTLRSVMGALSSLHAQGRKVGVVTHVEEMKEQIPARVEVVRTSPGRSEVRIRG